MGDNENSRKKCGDCAYWKTPNCSFSEDVRKGLLRSNDDACCDFYANPRKKGKLGRKVKLVFRDSGLADQGYFEAIYHKNKPCFLVLKDKAFSMHETVSEDDKTFNPKEVKRIPYEPYGFFEGTVPGREELFWSVRKQFEHYVDIESVWLDVLAAHVLLTYQQEKMLTVPYISLYGDTESGKSTVLQLQKFLCYRPLYGVTIPAADIYGYLEDMDSIGCVLEDEIQGIEKDTDKIKIYKAGYKQGAVVPRTIITQYDRIIKYYNTFCTKVCASERIPLVKGFRERFLEIGMVEGYPEKEWADSTPADLNCLRDLRNKLLKWRLLSREWQLPSIDLKMKGRLKELWKPLLQVTHGLSIHSSLADFVEEQKNVRLATKQNTLEGHIVKVVTTLHNEANVNPVFYIPFKTIWFALVADLEGKIDDKKPHVMDTSEFFYVTKSKVGYRLREVLGGKSMTVRQKIQGEKDEKCPRIKAYDFNWEKVRRVAKKYGYEFVTKLQSKPTSKRTLTPSSTSETSCSTLEKEENNIQKGLNTPKELSSLSDLVTHTQKLERLTTNIQGKCVVCGFEGRMDWQVTLHDGTRGLLCGECGHSLAKQQK